MFKGHPKGLIPAALANMGERFGFYVMMAILALFLTYKFGFVEGSTAAVIFSVFYAMTYVLTLVGGFIADRTRKYKKTILIGLIFMSIGYSLIAIPTPTPVRNMPLILTLTCFGLLVIAFGNGLFKGNLQAVVGQMYDNPRFAAKRDTGFQIFYMFINVGALLAAVAAVNIRNWWVVRNGFTFNADMPLLSHEYLRGTITPEASERFAGLAAGMNGGVAPADLGAFAGDYLNVFNTGYHYAFGVAIVAMLISLVIFLANRKKLPDPALKTIDKSDDAHVVQMDVREIRQRIYALLAVFGVVIFFWFSFHQNGLTLTHFANDYTELRLFGFNLGGAESFQFFNPFFVVFLTPIVIAFFGWLRAKGKEPSTPKKIAIGMGIAALAYVVMVLGSFGLPDTAERVAMGGLPDAMRVTPWLLIGTYLILTIAELFISPLGLSFVSKVAPPQYQGIMQGAWFGATALGNQLLFIGMIFYRNIPIWATWTVFVVACLLSMCTMLAMLKWLERATK